MQDLQLAFFKAQVPHLDTPQDHAFFAGLYNFAARHGFKYILTGANYSTECVREPLEWHYHASDLRQLKDIHRRFGKVPLETFPLADIFTYKLYYRFVKGVRIVKPLNYVPYIKDQVIRDLVGQVRLAELSAQALRIAVHAFLRRLLAADQVRLRQAAGALLQPHSDRADDAAPRRSSASPQPAYDQDTMAADFEYVATKLDLSVDELRALMAGPNKTYRDYKNSMGPIDAGTRVLRALGLQQAIIR